MPTAPAGQAEPSDLCSRPAVGTLYDANGDKSQITWQFPEETPVAILINSVSYAVMMATPADLRDFALGFLSSEAVLRDAGKIRGILEMPVESGISVDVAVDESAIDTSRLARRTIEGRSGCGLCGVEEIEAAVRPLPRLSRNWAPRADVIRTAAAALHDAQPMNRFNKSVHGAAWVSPDGTIQLVREDVGRHNALDKLIGALIRGGLAPSSGFVLMTSRCSYELVQKTVTFGIGALVTVSAPTALAYELAIKSGLFLASLGPQKSVAIFNS